MFGPPLNANYSTQNKYPVQQRTCTDIICVILFGCFTLFSITGMIYGFNKGNLENIAQPFDDSGNKCGEDNAKDYPLLFFVAPNSTDLNKRSTVCVKKCPENSQSKLLCYPNKNLTNCNDAYTYETYTFIDRFCIPYSSSAVTEIKSKLQGMEVENFANDIKKSWLVFLICLATAFIVSAVYCYLLEYCAGVVVTVLILGLLGALTFLGFLFNSKYKDIINDDDPANDSDFYYWCSIACWVLAGVLSLLVCCMWSRIMLAIKIIQAAADFITDYQRVILVPIFNLIAIFAYLTLWVVAGVHIFSVGDSVYVQGKVFGHIVWSTITKVFWYVHLVALVWNSAFALYLSDFVVCVVAITWYFATNKDNLSNPLTTGYKWGLFYHFGSLAFGSFILGIVWIVQMILAYLQQQVEQVNAEDNKIMKCFLKVASCLVNCFERFIKFLSKHAFIEVAMRSSNFCSGSATSMKMIASNGLRFGVLHGLCEIVITFGVFGITAGTLVVGFCLLYYVSYFGDRLSSLAGPLLIIALIGWIVAKLFGHVFSISADTLIHCYITEENETGAASNSTQQLTEVITTAKDRNGKIVNDEPAPGVKTEGGRGYNQLNDGYK